MPLFGENLGSHNFAIRIRRALIDFNSDLEPVAARLGFTVDQVKKYLKQHPLAFSDLYPIQSPDRSPYRECLRHIERLVICDALENCNYSMKATAKLLGLARSTLSEKCRVLGIKKPTAVFSTASNDDSIRSRA